MTRQGESPYIYGIHASSAGDGWGSTGADLLDGKGWIIFTEAIGKDSGSIAGRSYLQWTDKGLGVIVRLNHGYGTTGTIPLPERYGELAARCRYYVAGSLGCHIWIIGNEPNHSQEWPENQQISATDYASCYTRCRTQILLVQPDAQVLLAGPSLWNWDAGDFGQYWRDVLDEAARRGGYDGVAIHAYTHGADPALIFDNGRMAQPGEAYHWHFRVYRDLLEPVPSGIPIYITETDQDDPWADVNSGWVQNAYREVNDWNSIHPDKTARCLALYRWTHDKWTFENKAGVQADLMLAIAEGYKWTDEPPQEDALIKIPIANKGFEDGWREWHGIGEMKVANGWEPWWQSGTKRPEYKIAVPEIDPRRIHEGQAAQQWFTTHDTHHAGIYQVVDLTSAGCQLGDMLTFTAWAQSFTRDDDNDWVICNGRYWLHIGIDPYGGLNPEGSDVIWSEGARGYRWYEDTDEVRSEYMQVTAITQMRADRCTLFVRGQAEWPVKHNNAYVDSCALYYEGEEAPEPPEPPEPGPGGVTEERVFEMISQSFPGQYAMYEKKTMQKLAEIIRQAWSV